MKSRERNRMKWHADLFPDLCGVYPSRKACGSARVEHFTIDRHGAIMWLLNHGERVFEGRYVRLRVNNKTVMGDTWMERCSCRPFALAARSRVLVAGLGLGMALFPLRGAERVTKVTVLEKNPDVIRLVSPYVAHPKIRIVEADVYAWTPPAGASWDTIWFDVWGDRTTDSLARMTVLHRRYRKFLVPGGWTDSWYRDELRRQRRRDQRDSFF